MSSVACKHSTILASATVTDAVSFEWDFCDGSIGNDPVSKLAFNTNGVFNAYDLKAIEENGNHFMFALDYGDGTNNTGKILRYDFGGSVESVPTITNLGYFGVIQRPLGIGFWKEGNVNYALIVTGDGELFRLNFGNTMINTPSVETITGVAGLSDHRHIKIVHENGNILALIAGGNTTNISILNFGASITNQPVRTFITVPGANTLTSLDVAIECNNNYVIASGYGSGLHVVDFGSSFLNASPIFSQPVGFTSGLMLGLSILKSSENYYAVVSNQPLGIVRADFGNTITNPNPMRSNLGVFNSVNFGIGHTVFKSGSQNISASINYNGQVSIVEFPKNCELIGDYLNTENPLVQYDQPGNYLVTLSAYGENGEMITTSKTITVSDVEATLFEIHENGACKESSVAFEGKDITGQLLTSESWDFGDGATYSGSSPSHLYQNAGEYSVTLDGLAMNGCPNRTTKTISIFNASVADFDIPTVLPLCTNQSYVFNNQSNFDIGSSPTWQWKVNGVNQSVNEDLNYTFTQPYNQSVTLTASIPGCENSITKPISTLTEGPRVDFTFPAIRCEDNVINFENTTIGSVSSYSWNFGDGNTSTDVSSLNAFAAPAIYDVTLSASNVAGCNNSVTKSIQIYSKPVVNFNFTNPCNNQNTKFTDGTSAPTDSNLASWLWNFGDGSNTSLIKNPDHLFVSAGDYNVSLQVTTSSSCSSTFQKTVTINSTPVPDFSLTSPCEDVLVNFTGTSTGTVTGWDWQIGNLFYSIPNPSRTFANSGSYDAILAVTADNDCIGTITKTIVVPSKLVPDFTVLKNCTNQETLFANSTNDSSDPIASYYWVATGVGIAEGSPAVFTFPTSGNKNVKLTVNTETGCEYVASKIVNIISAPQANFTTSQETGGAPLTVEFTNTSSGATAFVWKFNETAISTNPTPEPFTYTELGEHTVALTAYNTQTCSHTFSRLINVVNPIVEVELNDLELQHFQNGTVKPMLTINNNGNVPLNNLALFFDISGSIVREYIGASIPANGSLYYTVRFELPPDASVKYFCAEADIQDQQEFNNKVCLNIENSFNAFTPYPNPATDQIHVEWISNESGAVTVTLINSLGREVKNYQFEASEGFNPLTIDTNGLSKGTYLVRISFKDISRTFKILVSQ